MAGRTIEAADLLIDSKHKSWIAISFVIGMAALGIYIGLDARTPGGLTGGSQVGLSYGLLGAACMVFAGLLAALRRVPHWSWLGTRQWWLRGHIWLGLLSAVFILCHGHYRLGGPLETALWLVFALTLVSGVVGLGLQQVLPRLMAARFEAEVPPEQITHVCLTLLRQADELVDAVCGPEVEQKTAAGETEGKRLLREFYESTLRYQFARDQSGRTPRTPSLDTASAFEHLRQLPGLETERERLARLEAICRECESIAAQERLHRYLHSWLAIHIPLSAALMVLGIAHVLSALYF